MKAFIIGLFSCALLGSGAALAHDLPDNAAGQGVSASVPTCGGVRNGAFVIVVLQDGTLLHKRCPSSTFHGSGTAAQAERARKAPNPVPLAGTTLGTISKFRAPDQTDPCYEWTVGGTLYVYCW